MNQAQCTTLPRAAAHPGGQASRATAGFVGSLVRLPAAIVETLLIWQERASERARLRQMDDYLLKDMGLSRADVEHEASVPFWRAS
jgi:uncharacterized protein YjiS (DUF1127 family)